MQAIMETLFPRAMSQAAAKQTFGECREGQKPRPLGRFKFDAPLLAAGFLTCGCGSDDWHVDDTEDLCLCMDGADWISRNEKRKW